MYFLKDEENTLYQFGIPVDQYDGVVFLRCLPHEKDDVQEILDGVCLGWFDLSSFWCCLFCIEEKLITERSHYFLDADLRATVQTFALNFVENNEEGMHGIISGTVLIEYIRETVTASQVMQQVQDQVLEDQLERVDNDEPQTVEAAKR